MDGEGSDEGIAPVVSIVGSVTRVFVVICWTLLPRTVC